MDIEEIKDQDNLLCTIFRSSLQSDGVKFLTPNEYTLQLGLLTHPKGKQIKSHIHNPDIKYEVNTTQEFLYIERGKVVASIYNNDFKLIKKVTLGKGDFMLHIAGGHGFEVEEDCRMIEIKQGPYPGPEHVKLYKD